MTTTTYTLIYQSGTPASRAWVCGLGIQSFSNSTLFLILENKDFKNYNYVHTKLDTRYLSSPITEIFQNENNSYAIAKVCIYVFRPRHTQQQQQQQQRSVVVVVDSKKSLWMNLQLRRLHIQHKKQ